MLFAERSDFSQHCRVQPTHQSKDFIRAILHWRACQRKTVFRLQLNQGFVYLGGAVLDAVGFIQNDTVEIHRFDVGDVAAHRFVSCHTKGKVTLLKKGILFLPFGCSSVDDDGLIIGKLFDFVFPLIFQGCRRDDQHLLDEFLLQQFIRGSQGLERFQFCYRTVFYPYF